VFKKFDICLPTDLNASFEAVTLLADKQNTIEEDILYVATLDSLNGLRHQPFQANLLLIFSPLESFDISGFCQHNITVVTTDISCVEAYAMVKKALKDRKDFEEKYLMILSILTMELNYQQIANKLFQILNHPIAFTDISFKTLGFTDCVEINDYVWQHYTTQEYEPVAYLNIVKDAGLQSVFDSEDPVLNTEPLKLPHRRLGCKIGNGVNMLGWVTLIEYFQEFTPYDFQLLKLVSQVLLTEFKKDSNYNYSRGQVFEYLIIDLLNGTIKKPSILQNRIQQLDFTIQEHKHVLVINLKSKHRDSLVLIRKDLESILYGSKTLIYGDNLILIQNKKNQNPFTDIEKTLLEQYIESNHLLCGISQEFSDLANIRQYYGQALKTVDIALKLDIGKSLLFYDDVMHYHMIDELQKNLEVNNFFDPLVRKLILFDNNYKTSFTYSLYTFLNNESDYVEAARILQIHKNTMVYRIKRVKEILNTDLNNNNAIHHMMLTFDLLKYLHGENFWEHINAISVQ
jgi:sugar diacid utilization regulator